TARHRAGDDPGDPPYPQEVRLRVRAMHPDGAAGAAADPEESRLAGTAGPCGGVEVHRRLAPVPPGADPRAYRRGDPAGDAGELDDPRRRADRAAHQPAARYGARLRHRVDGRDARAGAQGTRQGGAVEVLYLGTA